MMQWNAPFMILVLLSNSLAKTAKQENKLKESIQAILNHVPDRERQVNDIADLLSATKNELLENRSRDLQRRARAAEVLLAQYKKELKEAKHDIDALTTDKINLQREVSLVTAMSIIGNLEAKFTSGFNSSTRSQKESPRASRWRFIFQNHREAPEIKHILDQIHSSSPQAKSKVDILIENIAVTGDTLQSIESIAYKKDVVKIVDFLNTEKHGETFYRILKLPIIFREDVPKVVRKTALLLIKAYSSFFDTKLSEAFPEET